MSNHIVFETHTHTQAHIFFIARQPPKQRKDFQTLKTSSELTSMTYSVLCCGVLNTVFYEEWTLEIEATNGQGNGRREKNDHPTASMKTVP